MKKLSIILILVSILFSLNSCQKEEGNSNSSLAPTTAVKIKFGNGGEIAVSTKNAGASSSAWYAIKSDGEHDGQKSAKGDFYAWEGVDGNMSFKSAEDACSGGWRLPTLVEMESILDNVEYIRDEALLQHENVWVLKDHKNSNRFVYFQRGGLEASQVNSTDGNYWTSSQMAESNYIYALRLGDSANREIYPSTKSVKMSVRCVKTVIIEKPAEIPIQLEIKEGVVIEIDFKNVGAKSGGWFGNNGIAPIEGDKSAKGDYFTPEEAQSACPKGWRTPSVIELQKIVNMIEYKKEEGKYTGVRRLRDYRDNSRFIYMPRAGSSNSPTSADGYYASNEKPTTLNNNYSVLSFKKEVTTVEVINKNESLGGISLRCVRSV